MTITLSAWSESVCRLDPDAAAAIAATGLVQVRVEQPPDLWRVVSDSKVGVAIAGGCVLRVEPKLAIPRLMFLLSYAGDERGWRQIGPHFEQEVDLFAAVAAAFAAQAERALAPTPLHGYVTVEDRSSTLRGRLRVGEQLARWHGQPLPLEITRDDFTADIAENRMVRGAAELLLRLPLVAPMTRRRLLRIRAVLDDVEPCPPSSAVRAPAPTRLNRHYGGVLALAELLLRGASISTRAGAVQGISFAFDMNKVFEQFLSIALRTALERHGGQLVAQRGDARLDVERHIRLVPDLVWLRGGRHRAVIDAKYKPLTNSRFPNADAYQMLAYCTALELDRGFLVYAKDSLAQERDHTVAQARKIIHVRAIDVEQEPRDLLRAVEALAGEVAASTSNAASR